MKIIKFKQRITKIMKIIKFHWRINKQEQNKIIALENHKNQEN